MTGRGAFQVRKLALAATVFVLSSGVGAALIWSQQHALAKENLQIAAALTERAQARDRLLRIAEEQREVKEYIELYRRLEALHIIGEERRLEWVDAIARIRAQRELADLRYQIERQRLLRSVPGKPAGVDIYSSTMNVELALLHEGDLLRFLNDLRESGNAYYSVRRCSIRRTGGTLAGASLAPRLRAACQIDLITVRDHAAGT